MRVALITGITGQDGSFLAEFLLDLGYVVYGIIRRASTFNTKRIDHIFNDERLHLRHGDLSDTSNLMLILSEVKDRYWDRTDRLEIYNLAAMSHVKVSFEIPEYCSDVNGTAVIRLVEAVRLLDMTSKTRLYQASTSELFGKVVETPQKETTPFCPQSPYAVAKLSAYWTIRMYREAYGIFACNGILFNHESERRGKTFVTRKITTGLGEILRGTREHLALGNLSAKRDWGYARDFVKGMYLILQQDRPEDYVLATGEQYSVRDFVEKAFALRGLFIHWQGHDDNNPEEEIGTDQNGVVRVVVDRRLFRPAEVETLLGDATKAKKELGWTPETTFEELVQIMVDADCPPRDSPRPGLRG
jgi:GDPmannose 4,6-dehydratase